MSGLDAAFLLALLFTCLLVGIEVPQSAKASLRASLTGATLAYLLLLGAGNVLTTVLAYVLVIEASLELPPGLLPWKPLLSAAAGVFAFRGVLATINLFKPDVFTLETWIGRARDRAVASAVARQTAFRERLVIANARRLVTLPEAQLNAYVVSLLKRRGREVSVGQLDAAAADNRAERRFYKALELASRLPDHGAAILGDPEPRQPLLRWATAAAAGLAACALAASLLLTARPEPPAGERPDRLVSMSLDDADVHRVFEHCAREIEGELVADTSLEGSLDVHLQSSPLPEVMDDLCTIVGCRWELVETEPPRLIVQAVPGAAPPAGPGQ